MFSEIRVFIRFFSECLIECFLIFLKTYQSLISLSGVKERTVTHIEQMETEKEAERKEKDGNSSTEWESWREWVSATITIDNEACTMWRLDEHKTKTSLK